MKKEWEAKYSNRTRKVHARQHYQRTMIMTEKNDKRGSQWFIGENRGQRRASGLTLMVPYCYLPVWSSKKWTGNFKISMFQNTRHSLALDSSLECSSGRLFLFRTNQIKNRAIC